MTPRGGRGNLHHFSESRLEAEKSRTVCKKSTGDTSISYDSVILQERMNADLNETSRGSVRCAESLTSALCVFVKGERLQAAIINSF